MGKQWDYFHRITEQREHMSVLVDASYSGTAPLPGFTRLLSVVVNLYAIATDKEERDIAQAKLGILERRLEALFSEHIQALYIGRINTETRLEFYYYAGPGGAPHQKLAETVMADYPKYRWVAAERDDAEWTFYTYLRPNDIEKLYAKNNILLQSLSQKGDRLDIARDVFHWLRFGSSENLRSAADSAKRLGYSVVNSDMDADKPTYQHTLIISKNQSLGVEVMNESVRELYDLTNTFSGKYEGWGTDIRQKLWRKLKSGITGKRIAYAALLLLAVALIAVPLIMAKYI